MASISDASLLSFIWRSNNANFLSSCSMPRTNSFSFSALLIGFVNEFSTPLSLSYKLVLDTIFAITLLVF